MSNVNTKSNVRTIAVTGMLSAVAVVLMYLEIPIPIMPGFIKFDFSDLPALLGAYALGPVAGIIICLIKNVVHLAASQSMLVGELSNFILGSVFVFTAGIVYKKKKSKTGALLGGLCGAMAMGVFSVFSNYLIVYPVYYKLAMPEVVILSLYQAIIPSMKSIFAAAGVVTFMNAWNNYLWAKVIMSDNTTQTMPMLISNLISGYVTDYGMLMLAVLITTIPTAIVFFALQKHFVEGITGSVK